MYSIICVLLNVFIKYSFCISHKTNEDPFINASKTYFSSCHTKAKLINSGKYSNKCEKQRRYKLTRVSN